MSKTLSISIIKAKELLKSKDVIVADIRDQDSFNLGHVTSAINLTNENISDFISTTPKNTPIIVMCYHGISSKSVAEYLTNQQFTSVYSVDGGYEMWKLAESE